MQSDRSFDEIFESFDEIFESELLLREQVRKRTRTSYEKMFREMSTDEKIDFLIEEFIKSELEL